MRRPGPDAAGEQSQPAGPDVIPNASNRNSGSGRSMLPSDSTLSQFDRPKPPYHAAGFVMNPPAPSGTLAGS